MPMSSISANALWTRMGVSRDQTISYLYIPLIFGVMFGWMRVGRTYDWSFISSMAYWIIAVQICWLADDAMTRFAQRCLLPRRLSLVAILVCGALIGKPVIYLLMTSFVDLYQSVAMGAELQKPLPPVSLSTFFNDGLIGASIWVATNLALVHFLGVSRFGYSLGVPDEDDDGATSLGTSEATPEFIQRLKRPVGPLLTLKAEQHYLRVIGEYGDDLILYRISNAIDELRGHRQGLQVHRSFWVALAAVSHTERDDRGLALRLTNGALVPVSRSFRDDVLRAGFPQSRPHCGLNWGGGNSIDAIGAFDRDIRVNHIDNRQRQF